MFVTHAGLWKWVETANYKRQSEKASVRLQTHTNTRLPKAKNKLSHVR